MPDKKKKYLVTAAVTTYCTLEVEAESVDEARILAIKEDGGAFVTDDEQIGSFEITNIQPVI